MTHTLHRPPSILAADDACELPSPKIIALLAREIRRLPRSPERGRRIASAIRLDPGQLEVLLAA